MEGGKEKVKCRMCTMMWSSQSQMRKLPRSYQSEVLVTICSQNEDMIVNGGVVDEAVGNHIKMMKPFVMSEVFPNIHRRAPDSCAVVLR